MQNNFDHYRVLRERISLKLDALCERFDQLANDNPERSQLLRQIEALNKAYCDEYRPQSCSSCGT
jgi:CHASE3 domain sensor protein